MLLLEKFQTYLLHFHREVNITNIPIFLLDVIFVYESHVLIRGKHILYCSLFHSISFRGKVLYLEYVTHHSGKMNPLYIKYVINLIISTEWTHMQIFFIVIHYQISCWNSLGQSSKFLKSHCGCHKLDVYLLFEVCPSSPWETVPWNLQSFQHSTAFFLLQPSSGSCFKSGKICFISYSWHNREF